MHLHPHMRDDREPPTHCALTPDLMFQNLDVSPDISSLFFRMFYFQSTQAKTLVRVLRSEKIHPGQLILCQAIEKSPGLSQSELAARLAVKPATVTVMLQKMEKSGLVVRQTDPKDQRVSRIFVTEQGKQTNTAGSRLLSEYLRETVGRMRKEEAEILSLHLRELQSYTNEYQLKHFSEEQTNEQTSEVL